MSKPQHDDRSNLIVVNVDQWRGDCLGIAGHPAVETPTLDGWANNGVRFGRAYSATPVCIPARAALLTGLAPEHHGRIGYRDGVFWDYDCTLPGELGKAGYQTQAIGKLHVHPARNHLGFDNVILHDGFLHFGRKQSPPDGAPFDDYLRWARREAGFELDLMDHGVHCNSWVARPWPHEERLHPTNWVVTESIDFLRRRDPTRPFFLWMSFVRPHPPFDPPRDYFEQYLRQELPAPPVGDWVDAERAERGRWNPTTPVGRLNARAQARAQAGYYALMTHIDHQLMRFIEALTAYGEAERTAILFVSDHGELMGDHHLHNKSLPYEGSARVPFILTGPRALGLERGQVVDDVIELRDVMPTLLDLAGASIPEGLDGRSVLPLARGERPAWRDHLHGELTNGGESVQWITDDRYKYAWFSGSGTEQLFDLQADPQECCNLAADPAHADALGRQRTRLMAVLADREEGFVQDGRLVRGRPVRALRAFLAERLELG